MARDQQHGHGPSGVHWEWLAINPVGRMAFPGIHSAQREPVDSGEYEAEKARVLGADVVVTKRTAYQIPFP
jgi:hypothetical protein